MRAPPCLLLAAALVTTGACVAASDDGDGPIVDGPPGDGPPGDGPDVPAIDAPMATQCEPNPCGLGSCTPSGAGYSCDCPPGYGTNGTTCVLQDECTAGTDDCVGLATCFDPSTAPSDFVCTCPHLGFGGDGRLSGSGCSNINECASDPCGANDDGSGPSGNGCTERALGGWTQPGYDCSCAAGYVSNGMTCVLAN